MANSFLRITAPGWATFTGNFGGVNFTNGLSDTALVRHQIDRISALVVCDLADETGVTTVQAGLTGRLVGGSKIPAEIGNGANPTMRKATQEDIDADMRQRVAEAQRRPSQLYTKEQLANIANKEGIAGLRKIGDAWSVRERNITKLIDLIVNAQGAFTALGKQKGAQIAAQRVAAQNEMLAKHQAREAEIEKRGRLVTAGGLSNAIGPDGQNVTINAASVTVVAPATVAAPATS